MVLLFTIIRVQDNTFISKHRLIRERLTRFICSEFHIAEDPAEMYTQRSGETVVSFVKKVETQQHSVLILF
jgi:hypothetical protein